MQAEGREEFRRSEEGFFDLRSSFNPNPPVTWPRDVYVPRRMAMDDVDLSPQSQGHEATPPPRKTTGTMRGRLLDMPILDDHEDDEDGSVAASEVGPPASTVSAVKPLSVTKEMVTNFFLHYNTEVLHRADSIVERYATGRGENVTLETQKKYGDTIENFAARASLAGAAGRNADGSSSPRRVEVDDAVTSPPSLQGGSPRTTTARDDLGAMTIAVDDATLAPQPAGRGTSFRDGSIRGVSTCNAPSASTASLDPKP
jgi:hypothetical protein